METTRLSTKGQVVLPLSLRAAHAWTPGTEFSVEEAGDGILLRPIGGFPEVTLDQVAGCLRGKRKAKALKQMDAAIKREVDRRRDRGRY